MPIMLYPKCWRGREDCQPVHAIDGVNQELTDDQFESLNYEPDSFVCCGLNTEECRSVDRDIFRLCFKNSETDTMYDHDHLDLHSLIAVASAALSVDSARNLNNGLD